MGSNLKVVIIRVTVGWKRQWKKSDILFRPRAMFQEEGGGRSPTPLVAVVVVGRGKKYEVGSMHCWYYKESTFVRWYLPAIATVF